MSLMPDTSKLRLKKPESIADVKHTRSVVESLIRPEGEKPAVFVGSGGDDDDPKFWRVKFDLLSQHDCPSCNGHVRIVILDKTPTPERTEALRRMLKKHDFKGRAVEFAGNHAEGAVPWRVYAGWSDRHVEDRCSFRPERTTPRLAPLAVWTTMLSRMKSSYNTTERQKKRIDALEPFLSKVAPEAAAAELEPMIGKLVERVDDRIRTVARIAGPGGVHTTQPEPLWGISVDMFYVKPTQIEQVIAVAERLTTACLTP